MTADKIFKIVGLCVCWGLAILIGLLVFSALADLLIAFASTGIGAIILALIAWKLWKEHVKG